jgi:hypothetical protein
LPEKYRPKSRPKLPCLGEFKPTKNQIYCEVCRPFAYAASMYEYCRANRKKLRKMDRENREKRAHAAGRLCPRRLGHRYPCEYLDERGKRGRGCLRAYKLKSGKQKYCEVCQNLSANALRRKRAVHKEPVLMTCATPGCEVQFWRKAMSRQRFCTPRCRVLGLKRPLRTGKCAAPGCGREFKTRFKRKIFCSHKCKKRAQRLRDLKLLANARSLQLVPAASKRKPGRPPGNATTMEKLDLMGKFAAQDVSLKDMSVLVYPEKKHTPEAAYNSVRKLSSDYRAEFKAAKRRYQSAV